MKLRACPLASTATRGRSRGRAARRSPRAFLRAAAKLRRGPGSRPAIRARARGRPCRAHSRPSIRSQDERVDPERVGRVAAARAELDAGGHAAGRRPRARAARRSGLHLRARRRRARARRLARPFAENHAGIEIGPGQLDHTRQSSAPSARSCGRRSVLATLRCRRRSRFERLRIARAARADFAIGPSASARLPSSATA